MTDLQPPEGVVLHSGDLVSGQVEDSEVLQTPEHVCGDEVDEISIEGELKKLPLTEESPRLQRGDAVVLEVEVMEATKSGQVQETDLHNGVVLEEDGLQREGLDH